MRKFLLILLFILLIAPTSALSVTVSGGCVNQRVTVTADEKALVIFRMNDGTPIFAEVSPSQPAYFLPKITGNLNVTVIADTIVTKILKIEVCHETESAVETLPPGYFKEIVDGVEYKIKWRTALGALVKAAKMKGFTYKLKSTEWGPFVECIKDICTGYAGKTSGWMYWVNYPNEPLPSVSADEYVVKPGDEIIWYFSRSMEDTPDKSPFKVVITLGDKYEIYVSMKWSTKVPPVAYFTYKPANPSVGEVITFDASASFDPDGEIKEYIWEFGDGETAKGKIVEHKYEKEGVYEVKLTVIDNDGLEDSKVREIKVAGRIENITEFRKALKLQAGKKLRIEIPESLQLPLTAINLTSNEEKSVELVISKAKLPDVLYADVYSCFKIEVNSSVDVEISFKVAKSWNKSVQLFKYSGKWIEIPVELIGEDDYYYYYSAKLKSLSVFVVASKWKGFPLNASDEPIVKALNYLRTLQNPDGGFANPGESSSIAKTSWAIMAIVAAGEDPHEWRRDGKSPVDYIREHLRNELPKMGTADYARTILALIAANEDPRNFAGLNLVAMLKSKVKEDGQIGDFIYTTIWGILALYAAGEDVSKSIEWLKAQQNNDGGFAWAVGEKSDFDDTAAAIQALIAAGEPRDSEVIKRALDYLKEGQNDDGGMRYFGESASNAASDSWTIQALVAAGINPMEWKKNNISVVEHLLSLQTDEGYFKYTKYQTSNPGYMTVCAIMALLGKPQPIKVLNVSALTTVTTTTTTTATTTTATTTTIKTTVVTTTAAQPAIPGFEVIVAISAIAAALRVVRR